MTSAPLLLLHSRPQLLLENALLNSVKFRGDDLQLRTVEDIGPTCYCYYDDLALLFDVEPADDCLESDVIPLARLTPDWFDLPLT